MPPTASAHPKPHPGRPLAALAAAMLTLASLPTPPAAANPNPTLRVGITQGVDSLNPFLATFSSSTEMGRLMYDFLTRYSPGDQSPMPGLAEHWHTSRDGLTWTYTIRRDAHWSDGQPVTAHDVAFTYRLIMANPDAATANGSFVENFASVADPDERTLTITLKHPAATMLALDIPIVPAHIWRTVANIRDYANDHTPIVGSGPFQLLAYRPDQYLRLRANPHYWGGAPHVRELVFRYFKDTDAETQALLAGEIDLIGNDAALTPAQFTALARQRMITVNRGVGRRLTELAFNPGARTRAGVHFGDGHPALADERVRAAIGHAIDKPTLVKRALGGFAQVGEGYLPPAFAHWSYQPPAALRLTHDPHRANQILDAAGYTRGRDGVRRMPGGGRPLRLRLIANADRPAEPVIARYLRGWLAQIGVAVNVQTLTTTRMSDVTSAGDYDMFIGGLQANPDPDAALAQQTCAQLPGPDGHGGATDSFFCDPAYDQLYTRQRADLNPAQRAADVRAAQAELYGRHAQIILYYRDMLEAHRKDRFGPFTTQPAHGGVITRQDGYWGYLSANPTPAHPGQANLAARLGLGAGLLALVGVAAHRRRRAIATRDERE